jgi:hypothetical protein
MQAIGLMQAGAGCHSVLKAHRVSGSQHQPWALRVGTAVMLVW